MKRRYFGLALGALITVGAVLSLPSCGHDQKLVSVAVNPALGFTFLSDDTSLTFQYTATGTYIHPPATKDITKQVAWAVDFPELITFSASTPGLVSPEGDHCGVADISATAPEGTGGSENIVIGYSTVTVDDPSQITCPGGGKEGSVNVAIQPSGAGSIISSPAGISCPTVCGFLFPVGSSVLLTATPIGAHTFSSWTNCPGSGTGNSCAITVPVGGAAVIANFQ
jgi:hypothetical protein